jgi:mannitol-1-/sugar-/sorbitol-6-phosphatase
MQISCSAILFDMDGVLIDSTPAVGRVWRKWAVQHGFDPEEVVNRAHGRPSIATVKDYLPDSDHEAENLKIERQEIEDVEGIAPLPGALQLLSSLPLDRWAIVTSCTRTLAEVRIRAGKLPVPKLFLTATDVVNGKPHPEPYLSAALRLGFAPETCIVVEDVPAGIRAGKAANMRVVALRTTVPDADLEEAQPDWLLDSCASISATMGSSGLLLNFADAARTA